MADFIDKKRCAYCQEEKPLAEFYKTTRGTYSSRCQKCQGLAERTCLICGKAFTGKLGRKACGDECHKKLNPPTFKICLQCGQRYGPVDHLGRKFCGIQCKNSWRRGKSSAKKGKKYPHLCRARIACCPTCGKSFRAVKDFWKQKQIYCSHRCYLKYCWTNHTSYFENDVFAYLKNTGIPVERAYHLERWKFDGRLVGTNILVEADGQYWHSQAITQKGDLRKNVWCAVNGWRLIRIKEIDFRLDPATACNTVIECWESFTGKKAVCERTGKSPIPVKAPEESFK